MATIVVELNIGTYIALNNLVVIGHYFPLLCCISLLLIQTASKGASIYCHLSTLCRGKPLEYALK